MTVLEGPLNRVEIFSFIVFTRTQVSVILRMVLKVETLRFGIWCAFPADSLCLSHLSWLCLLHSYPRFWQKSFRGQKVSKLGDFSLLEGTRLAPSGDCIALFITPWTLIFTFIFIILIMAMNISLCTYNSNGLVAGRMSYVNDLSRSHHFVLVQEHWQYDEQSQSRFEKEIPNGNVNGVSEMDPTTPLVGRPFGGCCILWQKDLVGTVTPIPCDHKRIIAHYLCIYAMWWYKFR